MRQGIRHLNGKMPTLKGGGDSEQSNYRQQARGPSLDSAGSLKCPPVSPQPPSPEHVESKPCHFPPLPTRLFTSDHQRVVQKPWCM